MFAYQLQKKYSTFSDYAMFVIFLCSIGLVLNAFLSLSLNSSNLIVTEFALNLLLSYAIYSISKYKNVAMILFFLTLLIFATNFFNNYIIVNDNTVFLLYLTSKTCYLVTVVYLTINYVFTYKKLSNDKIFGMIGAYLLLAIIWACLYTTLFMFMDIPFYFKKPIVIESYGPGNPLSFAIYLPQMLYYSFITLTSLAFGDILPIIPISRTLATIEVMIGKFYIAILIARAVQFDIENIHAQKKI
ncbi:ion channel [Legionella sp. W05-934-2]|uniref:ion channel n=1 Tax=Legionella sp. W05-934-2 TaxID=1198649 RepID=UPI003461A208